MVDITPLRDDLLDGSGNHALKTKLRKKIRDRVKVCDIAECWPLKDGLNADISLSKHYFNNAKYGKHMTIRQVLFQLTFHELPPYDRIIRMKCENSRCVNPSHFSATGWTGPSYVDMKRLIYELGWATEESAEEIHCGKEVAAFYRRAREAPAVGRPATFNTEG